MSSLAERERAEVCALFVRVGPDAPTLCGDWSTSDLAAHLVVREGHPAAAGILLHGLSGWTRRTQQQLASLPFAELIERLGQGPPWWSPMGAPGVGSAVNTGEFFVHHEDVRRASKSWTERSLSDADQHELWRLLQHRSRLLLRRSPVAVVLHTSDGEELLAKPGRSPVRLSGLPSELVLYLHGRKSHSHVELSGDPGAVEQFQSTQLRMWR
jgi:uncharacterized protein (TIGR03085 family)